MLRIISILSVLLLLPPCAAQAAKTNTREQQYVKLRLLPERDAITAGEEIWIGIEQSIRPDWHTYWQNPGDSGSAPRIQWRLPEGFEISDIHWPTPKKLPYGPLMNYGYPGPITNCSEEQSYFGCHEEPVVLLQKLKAPILLPAGPLELSADVDILVCKDECVPEFYTLDLILNGPESSNKDNAATLARHVESLPKKSDWSASFYEENGDFVLFSESYPFADPCDEIAFFPTDWGLADNTKMPQVSTEGNHFTLRQTRGDRPVSALQNTGGILTCVIGEGQSAIEFKAAAQNPDAGSAAPAMGEKKATGLLQAIMLAVFGGMVLNLMPCVFPVLSIKALSLVKIADKHPDLARLHGLSYTAGVVLSFVAIAALLIALKTGGSQIGWGFHLQNPIVVSLLAYLLFIIGLNLSGVFEFSGRFANIGGKLAQGQGLSNSFFTGILATLVATPCTAPFMATAIGFALTQGPLVNLIIFAALGFGLALPYLALSFAPFLQNLLPKPGTWMVTFKELLAFPMYASSAWLVWVMGQQTDAVNVFGLLMGMVLIAFAFWLLSHQPKKKKWRIKIKIIAIMAFLFALALLPSGEKMPQQVTAAHGAEFGIFYSAEKLETLLTSDAPVFVEMTAAWCITCKVNHAVALNKDSTKQLFVERNVQYLIGDWTNEDPEITKYLNSFGRNGVPIYVYYGARNADTGQRPEPIVLPQILTPAVVAEYVK